MVTSGIASIQCHQIINIVGVMSQPIDETRLPCHFHDWSWCVQHAWPTMPGGLSSHFRAPWNAHALRTTSKTWFLHFLECCEFWLWLRGCYRQPRRTVVVMPVHHGVLPPEHWWAHSCLLWWRAVQFFHLAKRAPPRLPCSRKRKKTEDQESVKTVERS